MGIFTRMADIVNANINAMLDRAEDPEKIIRLIIQEMEDTLVEVRSSAVKTIAEQKEAARRLAVLEAERDDWTRKAEFALQKDREDLAKAALVMKARLEEEIAALQRQQAEIARAMEAQGADVARLEKKLDEAKARRQALTARARSAGNRVRMRGQLHDSRITDAFARFEQMEQSLDRMEGKAEAYDLGRNRARDPETALVDELGALEGEARVEQELNAMKARLAARRSGADEGAGGRA